MKRLEDQETMMRVVMFNDSTDGDDHDNGNVSNDDD